jgi:hypothetical protein
MASSLHAQPQQPQRRPRAAQGFSTLRLLPSADGWSLVGPRGGLIFRAAGMHGRQRCLRYAQAEGVLTILS